ncbi:CHAT domain-containing protein [Actinokineospora diospyrosa]|uniref:CHAT domain-containing protein n=1 Tax=Actinokineospora diospyrosa TaxID=103728 RepID=UPI0031E309DE
MGRHLKQRVDAFFDEEDVAGLDAPDTRRIAEELWERLSAHDPRDTNKDTILARMRLGKFHLVRHSVSGEDRRLVELARAVVCFLPYATSTDLLPTSLRTLLHTDGDVDAQVSFGSQFLMHSKRAPNPELLDAGIALLVPAMATLPADDPDLLNGLSNLCLAYSSRFERDGDAEDLRLSIAAGERAVRLPQLHDIDPVGPRFNLSTAYWNRYLDQGERADVLRTIDLLEEIAGLFGPGPERAGWLTEVSRAYLGLHRVDSDPTALTRAIATGEQAVAGRPGTPKGMASALFALAAALHGRYQRDSATDDLKRAVELGERCLVVLPHDDRSRVGFLVDVVQLHQDGYTAGLFPDGLDRALDLSEQAVALAPTNPRALTALIGALQERHRLVRTPELNGTTRDLDRAIDLGAAALDSGADHPRLRAAVAGAHLARFQYQGVLADLNHSIAEFGALLDSGEGTADSRRNWASFLGNAYQLRFTSTHDLADLGLALDHGEASIAPVSRLDPGLGDRCAKLAIAYQVGHDVGLGEDYLARAIELGELAISVTPEKHPDRGAWLGNLASAYTQNSVVADNARVDLDRAVDLHEQAVAEYPPGRSGRVRVVANLAAAYRDRLVRGGPGVSGERLRELAGEVEGDAIPVDQVWGRHAVGSLALVSGAHELAVAALDAAIALLPTVAPGHAGWADQQLRVSEHTGLVSAAIAAHCAVGDAVGAVRAAGLGRGVLLSTQAGTRHAGLDGLPAGSALVLVNADRYRSDAVIIRADAEPVIVELPGLRHEEVPRWALELGEVTLEELTTFAALRRRTRVLQDVLGWLWDSIAAPVLAAVGVSRIWWMPIGYLSVFPLHAAGHPGQPGVLDAVVSSYAPTLNVLQTRGPAAPRRQLVVTMTRTPGHTDLPGAAKEAAGLHAVHAGTALTDESATADRVLAALHKATWAHFACHATADLLSPANGGLWLHDGLLGLPDIGALRLPEAELAYLSACSTAHNSGRHADEALHLASTFHLAGFRHVIATLWPLNDHLAATAAHTFYDTLGPTPTNAATVLHKTTLALRTAEPDRPDLWATLIHSGP